MSKLHWEEIQRTMKEYGHRYHRKYCWHCDSYTIHEDGVCLSHDKEEELDAEEIEAEEDRRVNEDAQYATARGLGGFGSTGK